MPQLPLNSDQPVLIVDCQTTGANPAQGDLLEIAWCLADASGPLNSIQQFIVKQPEERPVPKRIQFLTGITENDLIDAVPANSVCELLQQALNELQPAYCVAHFARFENLFLRQLFLQNGIEKLPFELLCTFEIAKRLFPNLPSKGIRAVSGFFGTTCGELKRANSHVESTVAIWKNLVPKLSEIGIDSLSQISCWLVDSPTPKKRKFEYPLERSVRLNLPDCPGVYRMLSKSGTVLYVGKARSLKDRVNSYFRGQRGKDSKTKELLSQVWDLRCTVCETPLQAALLETDEIKRWDPPYNRALKRRHRALQFYSADFSSSNSVQDDKHPIGPFSSQQVIDPLLKLHASLKAGDFISDIFHRELPKVLLSEGFALFCVEEGVEQSNLTCARSVLALGLWLLRRKRREEREQAVANAELLMLESKKELETTQDDSEDHESDATTSDGTESEGTADPDHSYLLNQSQHFISSEDVSSKYTRMLRRVASDYLRSKLLTKMLHARVTFFHNDVAKELAVRNGSIYDSNDEMSTSNRTWQGLDIDTYDRMSVLLSEIKRAGGSLTTGAKNGEALLSQRLPSPSQIG